MHFWKRENFADREINERTISNPHPAGLMVMFDLLL